MAESLHYGIPRAVVLAAIIFSGAEIAVAEEPSRPEFDAVARAAAGCFQALPDYRDGDLLSRQHVAAALDAVAEVGWEVLDRKTIENRALADGAFLVRELSTPDGRKFMRKLSGTPGGYERLDRLSSISGGERTVRELIHQRGGEEMIEYLATTSGGHNLGRMMAGTRNGVDLNKPTGGIYTARDFLAVLKQVYEQTKMP